MGVTYRGGANGADETTGIATEYITKHTVDGEDVITTPLHTGDGKLSRGTGLEGENPEKEEKEEEALAFLSRFFSPWADNLARYSPTRQYFPLDQS